MYDFTRLENRVFLRRAVFALIVFCLAISPLSVRAGAAEDFAEVIAVRETVETFLRSFSEEALLYEDRDQRICTVSDPDVTIPPEAWERTYALSGRDMTLAQMRENIAFAGKKADYLSVMRQMQGIYRENLRLAYTFQKLDIQDDTCHVSVTEAAGFRYTDTVLPSVDENIYSIDLIKLDGRWLVARFTDGGSFDKQYMEQGGDFDVDAALASLAESMQVERCAVTSPYSGTIGWGQIPYNGENAAAYAYTYSRQRPEDKRSDYYSPLFVHYAGQGGDCMNFASQCMWAGFGGSETASAINARTRPMDASGSSLWYSRAHGGKGVANSWISCQSFRTYLTGTKDASGSGGSNAGQDAGMYATVLNVSAGSPVTGVTPEELIGAAVHVDKGGNSFSHAVVITAAEGTRRNQIWFCGHTANVTNVKLGDCYAAASLKIYIPRYMRTGTSQDNVIQPQRIQPVAVGETGLLGARTGSAQYRMWLSVTAPDGGTAQAAVSESANSCQAEYAFTQPGLYKVECYAMAWQDSPPAAVTYYVRCYELEEIPAVEPPEEEVPAEGESEVPGTKETDPAEEDPPVTDKLPEGI